MGLDGIYKVLGVHMGVDFGSFPVYMAYDGLQFRQIHAGADGSGDKSMTAVIGCHPLDLHQLH